MGLLTRERRPGGQYHYERTMVEALLAAHYNGNVIVDELQPEKGMPRAKANPALMGNGPVYMLDISRALARANLDHKTRSVLRLHYGEGWLPRKIGGEMGLDESTVSWRIKAGVITLTGYLNGERRD